ncbi:MAG: DNA repair protein RadA [Bacteroidetes bacterium]|nr:DNA repair protein RadA [Bacteroidota bacterium]
MAKQTIRFACQNCGYISPRWVGRCPECGEWNSFVEELVNETPRKRESKGKIEIVPLSDVEVTEGTRLSTGIEEFDRVLGGGLMPGSIILIAGDPGVGKSTLMMQLARNEKLGKILYVTGEESRAQVRVRAQRLGINNLDNLFVLAETDLELVAKAVSEFNPPILIVDSIQTIYHPDVMSAPGSVSQVRECSAKLAQLAKLTGTAVFVVGHVTKDGTAAGPKVLEHIVDAVLQLEGERHYSFRILRAYKNRFGSTNEIGIFEMRESGMVEVENPSEIFLSERSYGASGSTVTAAIEGTRPILLEIQALVTPTGYSVPQRTSTGFDYRRLSIILAVIEKRMGIKLGGFDVFLNVAGGVKIDEPAVDLASAISVISSYKDIPVDSSTLVIGEVGLAGEVRSVSQIERRVQEAAKLGFKRAIVPHANFSAGSRSAGKDAKSKLEIEIIEVQKISEAVKLLI